MRVLVCGDRDWTDKVKIHCSLQRFGRKDTVINGKCRGADELSSEVAKILEIPVEEYPAEWSRYNRGAGPIRNQTMLDTGIDLVIACHSDLANSKGTKDMVNRALKAGVTVEYIT